MYGKYPPFPSVAVGTSLSCQYQRYHEEIDRGYNNQTLSAP